MSTQGLIILIVVLFLLFGGGWVYGYWGDRGPHGTWLFTMVMLFILGWKVFGFIIHG